MLSCLPYPMPCHIVVAMTLISCQPLLTGNTYKYNIPGFGTLYND